MKLSAVVGLTIFAVVVLLLAEETQADTCSYSGTCQEAYKSCGWFFCVWSSRRYRSVACTKEATCTQNWGAWTSCTRTCGGGTRRRTGTCTASLCNKAISQSEACNTQHCPVNGSWTSWGPYRCSGCSATCGTNIVNTCTRSRSCTNPAPAYGGANCVGSRTSTRTSTCALPRCPIHGNWTDWSDWNCDACANKFCRKSRSCTNPAPAYGGRGCSGPSSDTQYQTCSQPVCPANGGWSNFSSDWTCGTCSRTCGGGTQICSVTRTCLHPPCQGSNSISRSQPCNTQQCPVNGQWSNWYDGRCGECEPECGQGNRTCLQFRFCNNPAPAYGGTGCSGPASKNTQVACNSVNCPVNGGWSEYGPDTICGECSSTCGPGRKTCWVFRRCNNPRPEFGGQDCQGSNNRTFTDNCGSDPCVHFGNWSDYSSDWTCGTCSRTCGGGTQTCSVTRTCLDPPCQGSNSISRSIPCNTEPCPVDGGWSQWYNGTCDECDVTCGEGEKRCQQYRLCNNPAPANGGAECVGAAEQTLTLACSAKPCPVHGGWSEYGGDKICGECSTTCGAGFRSCRRYRQCNNPRPDHGGLDCAGPNHTDAREMCNNGNCSVTEPTCRVGCASIAPGYVAYFPHERNCNQFYTCEDGAKFLHDCPNGLFWNDAEKKCDWFRNVYCQQCLQGYKSCIDGDGGIQCAQASADCPPGTTDASTVDPEEENASQFACNETLNLAKMPDNTAECRGYYWCVFQHWIHMPCPPGTGFSNDEQNCVHEDCDANQEAPTVVCEEGTSLPVDSRSCNEYTVCANQRLVYMLCPTGTRFHAGNQTCVEQHLVACPGDDLVDQDCTNRPHGATFAHSTCSMYNECVHGVLYERNCPPEEPFFDPGTGVCTWPLDSPCGRN